MTSSERYLKLLVFRKLESKLGNNENNNKNTLK